MTQIKSGYITGTNAQLQALRPFLVAEGFVDDKEWNDTEGKDSLSTSIVINFVLEFVMVAQFVAKNVKNTRHLYTLSPDEDLEKAAKIIKEKFYE